MGRKNKSYSKNLKEQMYDRFTGMLHAGEGTSKREAIKNETVAGKIFSYETYRSYYKHSKYFADYVQEHHPECTTLRSARKYVNEWLQARADQTDDRGQHLSAWTIRLEQAALCKLYGITPDDPNYFQAPKRRREDIKRSRGDVARDAHFSELNNDEFVKFCKGTGCRRQILNKLEGRDLYTLEDIKKEAARLEKRDGLLSEDEKKDLGVLREAAETFPDQKYFLHHRGDKGGKSRFAPIIGKNKDQIIERMKRTGPYEKVWKHVPGGADIHGYRAEYATDIYRMYARPIENIPYDKINKGTGKKYQSQVYICRGDEKGKKLDKEAMYKASKSLGHGRISVVAGHYIRGL